MPRYLCLRIGCAIWRNRKGRLRPRQDVPAPIKNRSGIIVWPRSTNHCRLLEAGQTSSRAASGQALHACRSSKRRPTQFTTRTVNDPKALLQRAISVSGCLVWAAQTAARATRLALPRCKKSRRHRAIQLARPHQKLRQTSAVKPRAAKVKKAYRVHVAFINPSYPQAQGARVRVWCDGRGDRRFVNGEAERRPRHAQRAAESGGISPF